MSLKPLPRAPVVPSDSAGSPCEGYIAFVVNNVLSATCTLHGLVSAELTPQELDYADRDYDVTVAVRAVKA